MTKSNIGQTVRIYVATCDHIGYRQARAGQGHNPRVECAVGEINLCCTGRFCIAYDGTRNKANSGWVSGWKVRACFGVKHGRLYVSNTAGDKFVFSVP